MLRSALFLVCSPPSRRARAARNGCYRPGVISCGSRLCPGDRRPPLPLSPTLSLSPRPSPALPGPRLPQLCLRPPAVVTQSVHQLAGRSAAARLSTPRARSHRPRRSTATAVATWELRRRRRPGVDSRRPEGGRTSPGGGQSRGQRSRTRWTGGTRHAPVRPSRSVRYDCGGVRRPVIVPAGRR